VSKNGVSGTFEGAFFSLGHFRAPDRERGGGDLWAQVTAAHLFPLAYPIHDRGSDAVGVDARPSIAAKIRPSSIFHPAHLQNSIIIFVRLQNLIQYPLYLLCRI
jgi:hypothetical protein